MTNTSKTLVFFGNERLSTGFDPHGAPTLSALIENGYSIKAVVSHFTPGTSRRARKLEIEAIAAAHNIPVLLPQKLSDIKDELTGFNANAGILVAFGKIIPQSIIDIFPRGIINIHPSLLPLNRGSTPIEQAMLDAPAKTGVSVMDLVKEMDAGPVYVQAEIALTNTESKQELTEKLLTMGSHLLIQHLPAILDGSLRPTVQDESKATYTRLLTKKDSQLNPEKTATQLEREVRAFAGWPKSRLSLGEHQIIVTKAHVVPEKVDHQLILACAENSYLAITELIAPSGKTMSGEAFLRGYGA